MASDEQSLPEMIIMIHLLKIRIQTDVVYVGRVSSKISKMQKSHLKKWLIYENELKKTRTGRSLANEKTDQNLIGHQFVVVPRFKTKQNFRE